MKTVILDRATLGDDLDIKLPFDTEVVSFERISDEELTEGIKDYMAQYTLYKWYKRVNPQMADPSELESLKSDINHRINQRIRPVRRPVLGINI